MVQLQRVSSLLSVSGLESASASASELEYGPKQAQNHPSPSGSLRNSRQRRGSRRPRRRARPCSSRWTACLRRPRWVLTSTHVPPRRSSHSRFARSLVRQAVTAKPIFEAYTMSHSLLAKLLSDDPGKNAILVCGVGTAWTSTDNRCARPDSLTRTTRFVLSPGEENKVGVPLSLDYGTTSTDEDEMSWVGRLIPFSNETWGRADDDQVLDASQIMTQFAEGEVVNLESCNLFIDSVDDLVNTIKWAADKVIDTSRLAAEVNIFTMILPSQMKDDAADWLKEKKDTLIDKAVDGALTLNRRALVRPNDSLTRASSAFQARRKRLMVIILVPRWGTWGRRFWTTRAPS